MDVDMGEDGGIVGFGSRYLKASLRISPRTRNQLGVIR